MYFTKDSSDDVAGCMGCFVIIAALAATVFFCGIFI